MDLQMRKKNGFFLQKNVMTGIAIIIKYYLIFEVEGIQQKCMYEEFHVNSSYFKKTTFQ